MTDEFSDEFVATFRYLHERCIHWRNMFGLYDTDMVIESGETVDGTDLQCYYDHESKTAKITVNEEIDETEPDRLDMLAHHEVAEILLGPLQTLAMARDFNESVLEAETHAIINRLWNIHKNQFGAEHFSGQK